MVDRRKESLTFERLARINTERANEWHGDEGIFDWSLSDWMNALLGEFGEAANVIKKLLRIKLGLRGNRKGETEAELKKQLGEELADICMYLFLVAARAGINLEDEVVRKFNKVSEELGFDERL